MSKIRITEPMAMGDDTRAEIRARLGVMELSDGAARCVAGWFASPGSVGNVLASLPTGVAVELDDLLDDIHHTWREHADPDDRAALDMLATWAIRKSRP